MNNEQNLPRDMVKGVVDLGKLSSSNWIYIVLNYLLLLSYATFEVPVIVGKNPRNTTGFTSLSHSLCLAASCYPLVKCSLARLDP